MNLPRRTYYYEPKHTPSGEALIERIGDLCLEFPGYGYRRVTKQLNREGLIVNHKKVARIMRENNWSCRPRRRKWVTTTNSNHGLPIYPNLITDLTIRSVNQLWVADITYIRILTCFVYLAVILDVFSRKAIGYALSKRLDTKLTLGALHMAISDRHPEPGCIHHSDRGVQYASREYVKELTCYNFQISMSRKGNPYENAHAESFIKTLKSEEVELWEYRTMEDLQERIPNFIEDVYNQKRLHSSLGYRPPCEFEAMLMVTQNPCQRALIASP
jgi:putative transposase